MTSTGSLDAVLARARAACPRTDRAPAIECTGVASFYGARVPLRTVFAADGRVRQELGGPLARTREIDRDSVRQLETGGVAWRLELGPAEQVRIEALVQCGLWSDPDGPLEARVMREPEPGRGAELALRLAGGARECRLELDPRTGLARTLRAATAFGERRVELSDQRAAGGVVFPRRVDCESPGDGLRGFEIADARPLTALPPELFAPPLSAPVGVRFGPGGDVPMRRAPSGHLFVRPRVAGRDLGWMAFDTGAAASVIVPSAAAAAGLVEVGRSMLLGAGADAHATRLVRGGPFELGPLWVDELVWTESDALAGLTAVLGEPVAGVVGWDVLARAVVELDPTRARMALFDPAAYELARGAWRELVLHRKHPFVRARFEGDREGLFCIDSGAGAATVFFHSPAVAALGLLEGRATKDVQATGAGGSLAMKMGELAWFEIDGERSANPTAFFCLDARGAFADTDTLGTLGQALLEPFVLVFDYRRTRIAFVRRG